MAWYSIFVPDLQVENYRKLSLDSLESFNCQLLAVDIDNTLVPYHQEKPDQEALDFLRMIQNASIQVVLISNNSRSRVTTFAKDLDIKTYASAKKPLPFVYKRIMRDFKLSSEHFLCLGDQLLTDVLGAHLAGVKVIWSRPLQKKDILVTKINRVFESIIYKKLLKKGLINEKV